MIDNKLNKIILAECREWVGTPYQHQGSLKHVGCDCLGLLRGIWRKLYNCEPQELPAYTPDWGEADRCEHLLDAAMQHLIPIQNNKIGCVILFRWRNNLPAKHLGIISGEHTFIHAYERAGVVETSLGRHWQKKIVARFEFPLPAQMKDI